MDLPWHWPLTKPALKIQKSSTMTWTRVSAPTPDFSNCIRCSSREYFLLSSPFLTFWWWHQSPTGVIQFLTGHQNSASNLSVWVTRRALDSAVYFSLCFNLFPCSVLCENSTFSMFILLFCVVLVLGCISAQHPSGLCVFSGCTFVQSKHFREVVMKMWREEQKTWRYKNTTVLEEQVSHRRFKHSKAEIQN